MPSDGVVATIRVSGGSGRGGIFCQEAGISGGEGRTVWRMDDGSTYLVSALWDAH